MKAIYAIMLLVLVSCTARPLKEEPEKHYYSITISDIHPYRDRHNKDLISQSYVEELPSDSAAVYSAVINICAACMTEHKAMSFKGETMGKHFPTIKIIRDSTIIIDKTVISDWTNMLKIINRQEEPELKKIFLQNVRGFGSPAMIAGSQECLDLFDKILEE